MQKVARAMQKPGEQRERMTSGMYVPTALDEAVGEMEHALVVCTEAAAIHRRIREAVKKKKITKRAALLRADALKASESSPRPTRTSTAPRPARAAVVEVDSFSLEAYARRGLEPTVPMGPTSGRRLEAPLERPPREAAPPDAPAPQGPCQGHSEATDGRSRSRARLATITSRGRRVPQRRRPPPSPSGYGPLPGPPP